MSFSNKFTSNKSTLSKRKNNKSGGVSGGRRVDNNFQSLRSFTEVIPDRMCTKLKYPFNFLLYNSVANLGRRFTPNNAYDVDPTLGSTSTPGFSEFAALYSYYRVHQYLVDFDAMNADPLAVSVYICHTNVDPGTSSGYQQYSCGAYGHNKAISPKGGMDKFHFRQKISIPKLVGAIDVTTDDSFRALTNGGPTDTVYFGLGIGTISGANFTVGVDFNGYIEMWVEFYGRKNLLSSFKTLIDEHNLARDAYKALKHLDKQ
jgi:hypothetical protein